VISSKEKLRIFAAAAGFDREMLIADDRKLPA
jgi:hypothetical protein